MSENLPSLLFYNEKLVNLLINMDCSHFHRLGLNININIIYYKFTIALDIIEEKCCYHIYVNLFMPIVPVGLSQVSFPMLRLLSSKALN